MSNFTDIDEDFKVDYGQRLGSGAFGDVYTGIWKSRNQLVAVKRIKDFVGSAKAMIQQEVRIMKALNHPNLLKIYKFVQSKEGTYLIIQFCEAGNLQKQIKKGMPEVNCLIYLKQIVDGMVTVNKANHIHRDLKPQNILFTRDKKLKICDFGLARRITGDDPNKIQKFSAKGTPLFSSPQVLKYHQYSGKCDVWSAGAILVEMLTKVNPFYKAKTLKGLINIQDKLKSQRHFVLEGNYYPWFKEIVSKMLAFEEDDRWSFYQLQEHIDKSYEQLIQKLTKFDHLSNPDSQKQTQAPQSTQIYTNAIKNLKQDAAVLNGKPNQTQQVHGGKISRQQQKIMTRQKSRQLLTSLKLYIEYLYNRGKIFAEIGTKYFQSQKVKKQNGYKFMILFLAISTFIKSIQKILNTVSKQKQVTLPDGTLIVYSALDLQTIKQFYQIRKGYQNQMKSEIDKFRETIQLIWEKMNSQKYKKLYPSLMQNHKNLLYNISDMKKNSSKQTVEYYEDKFRYFFKTQCLQQNTQKLDESYLRIYYVCAKLANLNQSIPLSRFKDNYIINQVIEDSSKLTVDKIREQISVLNNKL